MPFSGIGSYLYVIKESSEGCGGTGGTIDIPVPPDSGDVHIPFNPFVDFGITIPKKTIDEAIYNGQIISSKNTKALALGENTNSTIYHAPFLMSLIFPTIAVGTWADDANATVTMTLDPSATSAFVSKATAALRLHLEDIAGTSDIDLAFYGGVMESYKWSIEKEDYLREEFNLKWTDVRKDATAEPMAVAADYSSQHFAFWDTNFQSGGVVRAVPFNWMSIILDDGGTDDIQDSIKFISASFEILSPNEQFVFIGRQKTELMIGKTVDMIGKLRGVLDDDHLFDDYLKAFEDRDIFDYSLKITVPVKGDTHELKCTDCKVEDIAEVQIPNQDGGVLSAVEITIRPVGNTSIISFAGTYDKAGGTLVPTAYLFS